MAQSNVHYGYIEGNDRRPSTLDQMFAAMPAAAGLFDGPVPVATPASEVSPLAATLAALRTTPEYAHFSAISLIRLINANPTATVAELVALRRAQQ